MRPILVPTLLATVALLLPAATADWASFHGDALNTGSIPSTDYAVYKDIWWSEKGGSDKQVLASPVLKDGRLIVADRGGVVRALDSQSGFEFWRYKMPASVEGTPAVSADHVYVADVKGNLKSVNLFTGAVEFEASTGSTAGNIAEHEGKVFLGTEAGELKAYLADLTLLWTFKASEVFEESRTTCTGTAPAQTCKTVCADDAGLEQRMSDQPIRGKPAVYGGYVYFGSLNHMIYAVLEGGGGNLKTSAEWFYKTKDVVVNAPTIVHNGNADHVVAGSYDGHVYMFAAKNSGDGPAACGTSNNFHPFKAVPEHDFPVPSIATGGSSGQVSKVYSSPANDGNQIYIGANNGFLYALRADTLAKVWEKQIGSEITPVKSSPAVAHGIVVVGSDDKNLYWLNASNGTILRNFPAQTAIPASPALEGNLAFVAAIDGTWYAFGPEKPKRPDLTVTSINATATFVTAVVRNGGDASSGATKIRVFANGGQLFEQDLAAIDAGNSLSIRHENLTLAKGTANILVFADPLNLVIEGDEHNNALNRTFDIGALPPPPPPQPTQGPGNPTSSTSKGKIPSWGIAVPVALVGVALLLRRRIR